MKITLDNAQSGGPQIKISNNGNIIGHIYPRADDKEMQYWNFSSFQSLAEMPEEDGIVLYNDE